MTELRGSDRMRIQTLKPYCQPCTELSSLQIGKYRFDIKHCLRSSHVTDHIVSRKGEANPGLVGHFSCAEYGKSGRNLQISSKLGVMITLTYMVAYKICNYAQCMK